MRNTFRSAYLFGNNYVVDIGIILAKIVPTVMTYMAHVIETSTFLFT